MRLRRPCLIVLLATVLAVALVWLLHDGDDAPSLSESYSFHAMSRPLLIDESHLIRWHAQRGAGQSGDGVVPEVGLEPTSP